jgi:acetyl-CoA carboxylase biotin carboxyl carrier protein
LSEKKRKTKPPGGGGSSGKKAGNGGGGGGAAGPMNVDFLQQLVDLMSANDLNTVDLRDGGRRIVLQRGAGHVITTTSPAMHSVQHTTSPVPARPQAGGTPVEGGADDDTNLVPIKSPMVGTFYSKPSPDAKPFVTVGSHIVRDETDVCIIEAMKTFNTLKADVSGTIVRMLVQDGQSVDVNKPLFLVKPS